MKMIAGVLVIAAMSAPSLVTAQNLPFEGQWSQLQTPCVDGRTEFSANGSKELLGGQIITRCSFANVKKSDDGYVLRATCSSTMGPSAPKPEILRLTAIGISEMTMVYTDGIRVTYRRCTAKITLPR